MKKHQENNKLKPPPKNKKIVICEERSQTKTIIEAVNKSQEGKTFSKNNTAVQNQKENKNRSIAKIRPRE